MALPKANLLVGWLVYFGGRGCRRMLVRRPYLTTKDFVTRTEFRPCSMQMRKSNRSHASRNAHVTHSPPNARPFHRTITRIGIPEKATILKAVITLGTWSNAREVDRSVRYVRQFQVFHSSAVLAPSSNRCPRPHLPCYFLHFFVIRRLGWLRYDVRRGDESDVPTSNTA